MHPDEYAKMYELEDVYWWFQGRKKIILNLMHRYINDKSGKVKVLDLGCGTGLIMDSLNYRYHPLGLDFSGKALDYCRKRGLHELICGDVSRMPLASQQIPVIVALDLIEHVEDDNALMKEMLRILEPGGLLFITAPAYKFLWGEHDEALYHFRRYEAKELKALLKKHNFHILKFSYAISFLTAPIIIFRWLRNLLRKKSAPKTHLIVLPRIINRLLLLILHLEAWLLRFINFPFGVSLVAVAQKPFEQKKEN